MLESFNGRITDATLSGDWADSGPGGTSLVGKMIILTSGSHSGKVAWILEDLGSKVARVSQFADPGTFATGFPSLAI